MHRALVPYSYEGGSAQKYPYLVYVFVYNEGRLLLSELKRFPPPGQRNFDIVIGDDGSTDGSVPSSLLQEFGLRGITRLKKNAGLSSNIKSGLDWCLSQNYKGVIMINGNDRDDPEAIPRFIEKMETGFDYVQGSRFVPGGKRINTPRYRYWAIRLLHAPLFSLAALKWMTDTTNGYRAFSTSFLKSLGELVFQDQFQKYEIEQYLAWKAIRMGKKVCEIPVIRRYPADTKNSNFTKISPVSGWWQMLKPLLWLLLRLYR